MATKAVDATQLDSDLTLVADSIRQKGGSPASLAFPNEFVTAIQSIPTGGGYNIISEDNGDGTQNIYIEDAEGGTEIVPFSISQNGTYTPPSRTIYNPIIANVPTGTARTSADLTISGATVTVPAGLYASAASKSLPIYDGSVS